LAETCGLPILYSVHPRSAKAIAERGFSFHPLVKQHKPLSFSDYNQLQRNARCVVSDSGTLPEEANYYARIGEPLAAVCVRTSTERPEALEAGSFVIGSLSAEQVLQAVETAIALREADERPSLVKDYADTNISTKVVSIIQSYTGIVDQMVWRKPQD
jgi:UDP-N-acetylglucosamine 2-epimerase (non-hydrolysing)